MYPAILLGASVSEGEGTFPQDVTIRDCIFRASGWAARHNAKGCIAIRNVGGAGVPGDGLGPQKEFNNAGVGRFGEDGLYMGTVRIEGCRFEDSALGIDIHHVKEVLLARNSFKNVDVPYRVGQNPSPRVIERKDGQCNDQSPDCRTCFLRVVPATRDAGRACWLRAFSRCWPHRMEEAPTPPCGTPNPPCGGMRRCPWEMAGLALWCSAEWRANASR